MSNWDKMRMDAYPIANIAQEDIRISRRPTRREILNQKIQYLEVELAGCKAALEALDQSPDIENVIELLDRFSS